jgi:hypothetical protein
LLATVRISSFVVSTPLAGVHEIWNENVVVIPV